MTGLASYLGRPVLRVEDGRLLAGTGSYTADLALPGLAHMAVVRSDHPSADILGIDTAIARSMPGVLGVWTGEDLAADGVGGIPWQDCPPVPAGVPQGSRPAEGDPAVADPQPVLARRSVRYQGEPVAIVVADSLEQARDAAELVQIDYAPHQAVTAVRPAAAAGAPLVWQRFAGNLCFTIPMGDAARTDEAFARAAHVVHLSSDLPRLVQNPIEPRNYVGSWDEAGGSYLLHAAAGKPQAVGRAIARDIFRIARDRIRVLTRDVGGGFGAKNVLYPEQVLVLWAARKIGRPVRWLASRSEVFVSDTQARDQCADTALALDAQGTILGLRASVLSNLGAYLGPRGVIPPLILSRTLTNTYRIPAVDILVKGVFSNTPPTGPYRGAGAPEAVFFIERLLDTAARKLGIAPAELRRRNLVPAAAMPHTSALGVTCESGDFGAAMAAAEEAAAVAGFAARRAESASRGKLRGMGYANMLEWSGIGLTERAELVCSPDGIVTAFMGSMSNGQSHETVYAQLIADALGLDIARIRVRQGDSDETPDGLGTGASRSMTVSGSALLAASDTLIALGRGIAADMLEVAQGDLEYRAGEYHIAGTDRSVTLQQVAARAAADADGANRGLAANGHFTPKDSTNPNGCHIAEVEIDPDTGVVSLLRYSIAQDVGRVLNPAVVKGQLAGGVAQGVGQALLEQAVFDTESGQLLSGSFMDYALPRADDLPSFEIRLLEIPCRHTPLGMKSCGEIGATGAPAATFNAVMDALAQIGVTELPVPATPQAISKAVRNRRGAGANPRRDQSFAGDALCPPPA